MPWQTRLFIGFMLAVALVGNFLSVGAAVAVGSSQPPSEPLVEAGQIYQLVWECTPLAPQCYGELVRVDKVRPDGWIDVTSCEVTEFKSVYCPPSERWRSNLAQVLSLRRFTGGRAAD